jgi:general secretion pathway protein I
MRARGFTLLEVLVAMAIVAIGMAAVLGTVTASADTVSYLRDKTFANWIALNQIAQLRLKGQAPQPGKSDGDTDYAARKWHWHQEIVATQLQGMLRIDVSVRPADSSRSLSDDSGWYVTLSGLWGDAVALPRGDLPDWGSQLLTPGTSGAGPNVGTPPGNTPGAPARRPTSPTSPISSPQPARSPTPTGWL